MSPRTPGRRTRGRPVAGRRGRSITPSRRRRRWIPERPRPGAVVAVLVVLVVLAAALFVARQVAVLDARAGAQRLAEVTGRLDDPAAATRIAAVYALERLAREYPSDQDAAVVILSAYVRDQVPRAGSTGCRPYRRAPKDPPALPTPDRPAADVAAAIQVLGRRDLDVVTAVPDLRGACLRYDLAAATADLGDPAGGPTVDLAGFDLSGTDLARANLSGADLTSANLTGAALPESVLSHAVLRDSRLTAARFDGADLDGADLTGAVARQAGFTDAELRDAVLVRTDLRTGDLRRANLTRADLTDADLTFTNLDGTTVQGATVDGVRGGDFLLTTGTPR